jgi:hypothetical protein
MCQTNTRKPSKLGQIPHQYNKYIQHVLSKMAQQLYSKKSNLENVTTQLIE